MRIRFAVAVALLVACAGTARASEPDLFGFGPRSSAMAGTGTASSDDWEAVYANPAGLGFARGRGLTVGYAGARYALSLDGKSHPIDATDGLLLGAQLPLPLGGALANRIVLALGFYLPAGVVNRARSPLPDVPVLALLDNRTQTVSVMFAAAARITDRISLGAGVLVLSALVGSIRLTVDGTGHITTQSEEQLVAGYAPIAGVRWDVARRVKLGAVFRGSSRSRYDISVQNQLGAILPFELPTLAVAGTNQFDPLQAALEVAVMPSRSWLLAANLTYEHWSDFAPPTEPVTMATPAAAPSGFQDRVVPRVAAEWTRSFRRADLALRAGYFFFWSPAPDGAMRTLLDASRHVITAGAGVRVKNRWAPLRLDGFFQWHQAQPTARVSGGLATFGLTLGAEL